VCQASTSPVSLLRLPIQPSRSSSKRTTLGLVHLASSMPRWISAMTVPSFGAVLEM
jgi:hypothetical protein